MVHSSLLHHSHNSEMEVSIFADFVGLAVKVPYRDGPQYKIARGVLEAAEGGFVKLRGPLGVIILNEKNIEKMSLLSLR